MYPKILLTISFLYTFSTFCQDFCKIPTETEKIGSNPFHPDEQIRNYNGIAFSNSGLKMFVVGSNGILEDEVYQYDLSVPYDVSTASFKNGNIFSYDHLGISAKEIGFSNDGLIMFISGSDTEKVTSIFRYNLDSPFNIKSASYSNESYQFSNSLVPARFVFSEDGIKLFYLSSYNGKISQIKLTNPYDIYSEKLDSTSIFIKDQNGNDSYISGFTLSKNGNDLFVAGLSSYEYKFSQYALKTQFDISSNEFLKSFPVPERLRLPSSIEFDKSGLIMITATGSKGILRYELSQPFDIENIKINYQSGNPASMSKYDIRPGAIRISDNGSYLYLSGWNSRHQLKFSEPYNLNSLIYDGNVEGLEGNMKISNDGRNLFIKRFDDTFRKYELSQPFDISSHSEEFNEYSFPLCADARGTNDYGFSHDGNYFYTLTSNPNLLCKYTLSIPFDLDSRDRWNVQTIDAGFIFPSPDYLPNSPNSLYLSKDGLKIFISNRNGNIHQLELETPNNLYSVNLSHIFSTDEMVSHLGNFTFSDDGNNLYLYDYELEQVVNLSFKENNPPVFTSQNKVAFLEGSSELIMDINANNGDCDPNDVGISYSITGVDSELFTVDHKGLLYFRETPNFETPTDSNRDNDYQITINASDDSFTSHQDVKVIVKKAPHVLIGGAAQIGQDIDGIAQRDFFGLNVSLSNDGKVVASGSVGDDTNGNSSGSVRVFKLTNDIWEQIGSEINGSNSNDQLGRKVKLSGDASTLAVYNGGSNEIVVYSYNQTNWIQKGAIIPLNSLGINMGISDDGNTLAVGQTSDPTRGQYAGKTEIFRYVSNEWIKDNQVFYGTKKDDHSGTVDLSADGNTMIIGSWGSDHCKSGGGLIRVFYYNGNSWKQLGNEFGGLQENNWIGRSVAISSDGLTVATGNGSIGASWQYVIVREYKSGKWIEKGQPLYGDHSGDRFGESLCLSQNGNIIAIGASWNSLKGQLVGKVHTYAFDGAYWLEQGMGIYGEFYRDRSGNSISLSDDGTSIAIGASNNDGPQNGCYDVCENGHVRVYNLINNEPVILSADESVFFDENSNNPVLDVEATNGDSDWIDYNLEYTIHGMDAALFNIDKKSGIISFSEVPDFENPMDGDFQNDYSIAIQVKDEVGLSKILELTIQVENINDNAPVFNPIEYPIELFEDHDKSIPILRLEAFDADKDDLHYSIFSGNELDIFSIDELTGEIYISDQSTINYHVESLHALEVIVSDGLWYTYQKIDIIVIDNVLSIKENEPISVFPTYFENEIQIKSNSTPFEVTIINLAGRVILQNTINQNNTILSTKYLNEEMYFIQISTNGQMQSFKILKNN